MRKKIFICSPFRGDVEGNSAKAAGYCRRAYEEGNLPIAPVGYQNKCQKHGYQRVIV